MAPTLIGISLALFVVGAGMMLIERQWPGVPGQRILRRGVSTDLGYWFFTPIITQAVTRLGTLGALVAMALVLGLRPDRSTLEALVAGYGPIGAQPSWLQAMELVVLLDLIGYWTHRLFHGGRLWAFHEVHHSSMDLDWLSSVRLHPINDLLNRLPAAAIVVLLGFNPAVLAGALPFLAVYAVLLHANVSWDFGPFRTVLASPEFHRWHHTSAAEGRNKNFAGLLPVWDLLFGTYYMPSHSPRLFGVDRPVPQSLLGELLYPFKKARHPATTPEA